MSPLQRLRHNLHALNFPEFELTEFDESVCSTLKPEETLNQPMSLLTVRYSCLTMGYIQVYFILEIPSVAPLFVPKLIG